VGQLVGTGGEKRNKHRNFVSGKALSVKKIWHSKHEFKEKITTDFNSLAPELFFF